MHHYFIRGFMQFFWSIKINPCRTFVCSKIQKIGLACHVWYRCWAVTTHCLISLNNLVFTMEGIWLEQVLYQTSMINVRSMRSPWHLHNHVRWCFFLTLVMLMETMNLYRKWAPDGPLAISSLGYFKNRRKIIWLQVEKAVQMDDIIILYYVFFM